MRRVEHPVTVRLQVENVEAAVAELKEFGGRVQYEPLRTAEQELLAAVHDPEGHTLLIWRPLTEDEYDQVPELPKEMTWRPEAEELLKALLKSVPSVSYTHLDVYKRQAQECAFAVPGHCPLAGCQER